MVEACAPYQTQSALGAITRPLSSQWPFRGHNLALQPRPYPEAAGLRAPPVVQEGLLIARPRERLRFLI